MRCSPPPTFASPTFIGTTIGFGSQDGHVYGVELASSGELWRFQTGEGIASTLRVVDGVIYFGSFDGRLYAVRGPAP